MPNPIYLPGKSPEDWRQFLAEPEKQWVPGYSAKELAYSWHDRDGLPDEVARAFGSSGISALTGIEILLAIPEHQVPLPPRGGRPTQTDLYVLGKSSDGLISIAVEGKVRESFGPLVSEWIASPTPGKKERLTFLCDLLGLDERAVSPLRYQLLHRTAAAVIEAKRFEARHALMLVHSFSKEKAWFDDYAAFLSHLGVKDVSPETVHRVKDLGSVALYCGWATGEPKAP